MREKENERKKEREKERGQQRAQERAQERKNQSHVEISTKLVCESDHQLKLKSDNINQFNSDKLG